MAYYAVAPLICALLFFFSEGSARTEENIQIALYLAPQVNADGPDRNAIRSVDTKGFGSVFMSDRTMADGPGPDAKIVGRVQAVNFKTRVDATKNIWSISLSLVFEDASRFNGSTLQVAGINAATDCEWSIVGGTGKLSMARGTVERKLKAPREKLIVDAYYSPKPSIGVSRDTSMESPV